MKAVKVENIHSLNSGDSLVICDDKHQHISKVMRSRVGDELLLLDGNGTKATTQITEIKKKETSLRILSIENKLQDNRKFHLGIGCTKKDYLEQIIRSSIEFGFKSVTFLKTEYSQPFNLNEKRVESIVESALVQSNANYLPEFYFEGSLTDFLEGKKNTEIAVFDFTREESELKAVDSECTLVIGPEGGFSKPESDLLAEKSKYVLKINCNILKASTMVPVAGGYLLSRLDASHYL